jgi:hypothetical protein
MCGWRAAVAGILLAVTTVAAQDPPNFSGEWVRVAPPQKPPTVLTVAQTFESIEIRPLSLWGPRPGKYRLGAFEAGVGGLEGGSGTAFRSSATWSNDTLVITDERSIMQVNPGSIASVETKHHTSHEEVWSLDRSGQLVVVITDRETGAADTTTRFVYERKR